MKINIGLRSFWYSIILILFCSGSLVGQQLPIFSESELLTSLSNPSKLASSFYKYDQNVNITSVYRHQWIHLDDAPKTFVANFDYYAKDYNFLWGGSFINDQTGKMSYTGLYLKGAYSIYLHRDLQVNIGLSGGLLQYRLKASELTLLEEGDIAVENESVVKPDFSIGATIYLNEKYYFGLSVPQIMGLNNSFTNGGNNFNFKGLRHYFGLAGMHIPLNDDGWLEANGWVRFVPNLPIHYGVNFKKEFFEKFWLGTGIASTKEFSLEAGLIFSQGWDQNLVRVGYLFSNFFNTYGPDFGSAHELRVMYSLDR